MARFRLRSRSQVVERCQALRTRRRRRARAAAVTRACRRRRRVAGRGARHAALVAAAARAAAVRPAVRHRRGRPGERRAGELRDPEELELERDVGPAVALARADDRAAASGALQLPGALLELRPADRGDRDARPRRRAAARPDPRRLPRLRQGLPPPVARSSTPRRTRSRPSATTPSTGSPGKARAGTTCRSTLDIEFSILCT